MQRPGTDLPGAAEALGPYLCSAHRLADAPLPRPDETAEQFFARAFRPVRPQDGAPGLLTGYFEPEIDARRIADPRFRHPIYRLPPEPAPARAEIAAGALAGQGLELAWLADPVDAFFLQVQGSGRLRLPDGTMRVGYAGRNGHPYRSIGAEMVAMGILSPGTVDAAAIRGWLARNPGRVTEVLNRNPSFVFFTERNDLSEADGPVGSAGVPLTALVSLAVDPAHVPLGAPVLVETEVGGEPFRRLMVAQDTGSAILGPQRGDIFFGTGGAAGDLAGRPAAPGWLTPLLPGGA